MGTGMGTGTYSFPEPSTPASSEGKQRQKHINLHLFQKKFVQFYGHRTEGAHLSAVVCSACGVCSRWPWSW